MPVARRTKSEPEHAHFDPLKTYGFWQFTHIYYAVHERHPTNDAEH